jgi:hypothetical protein
VSVDASMDRKSLIACAERSRFFNELVTSRGRHGLFDPIEGGRETRCWLDAAEESLVRCFANDVGDDLAVVRNAITSWCSDGQMEGQITRLKLIKRRMYEPAKFDLLKARLIVAT